MHHFLLGKGKRPGKDEINLPDKRELEKKHTDTHTHTHARTDTQTHTDTDILQFKVSRTPVLQMDEGEMFCCWLPYKLSEGSR